MTILIAAIAAVLAAQEKVPRQEELATEIPHY